MDIRIMSACHAGYQGSIEYGEHLPYTTPTVNYLAICDLALFEGDAVPPEVLKMAASQEAK